MHSITQYQLNNNLFFKAAHGQAQAQLTSAYKLRLFGPDIAGPNFVLLTCIVKSSQSAGVSWLVLDVNI